MPAESRRRSTAFRPAIRRRIGVLPLTTRLGAVLACAFSVMFLFHGCAATHEPDRWSRSVHEMPENVYGSWVWLVLEEDPADGKVKKFGGELIAVSADSVYVASPALRVLPRSAIHTVRLAAFDAYEAGVASLSLLGSLTTISNGWFLGITAPMWWIGGTIAATSRSYTPVSDYSKSTCGMMSPFARFPAGFPDGIDRSTITSTSVKRELHAY